MGKSRQSKAREFDQKAREEIKQRDRDCIFCKMSYRMEKCTEFSKSILSIMHYIPRSHGGLGIPENGAIGCEYHHHMFDNGNEGNRDEMKSLFADYLRSHYKGWNEKKLVYDKWAFLKGEEG